MPEPATRALPHGARGIDLGDAVLALANDKIVVTAKGSDEHLTIHLGPHTGVFDIHRTARRSDGSKTYETLYAISHADLPKLLMELSSVALGALLDAVRPLDVDVLAANRFGVVVGLLRTGKAIEEVTRVRRQKLVVDPEKLAARASVPEFLDELYTIRDGEFFTLFSTRRRQAPRVVGHGFAISRARNRKELMWLSNRRFSEMMTRLSPLICEAATRYRTQVRDF